MFYVATESYAELRPSADYLTVLMIASASANRCGALERTAIAYAASPRALKSMDQLQNSLALKYLFQMVDAVEETSQGHLAKIIEKLFDGVPRDVVVAREAFQLD